MPGGKRLWRTEKGDLVEEGHKDAVTLAYGIDDTLDKKDEDKVRKTAAPAPAQAKKAPAAANKKAPAPANKQAAKPADK